MKNWYDRGYLQVFDKESGEMLLEIETTLEHVERYTKYNFNKCEYAFIKCDYDYIIDNETLMKMDLDIIESEEE